MDQRESLIFLFLDRKYPFWPNLFQKIKIVDLSWNLVFRLVRICSIHGGVHFFCFRLGIPFLSKFGQKKLNCQFQQKFDIYANSNLQNSVAMFTFSIFDRKYPFKLKFFTYTNANMKDSMVIFFLFLTRSIIFFVLFFSNLFQKIEFVEVETQNLEPRLIRYVECDDDFPSFPFWIRYALFGLMWSKNSKFLVKLKVCTQSISNM